MARSVVRRPARLGIATLVLAALLTQSSTAPARAAGATAGPARSVATISATDTVAPTAPANFHLVSRTKSGAITLGWDASYDAVGVAGYSLYRDGTWCCTLYQAGVDRIGTVMYDRLGGRTRTPVTYDLYAFDAAGNVSAPATLVVTP